LEALKATLVPGATSTTAFADPLDTTSTAAPVTVTVPSPVVTADTPMDDDKDTSDDEDTSDDDTAYDDGDSNNETNSKTINRMVLFVFNELRGTPRDNKILQSKILDGFPLANSGEIKAITDIYTFFRPFVFERQGESDIDHHILPQLFTINACNSILKATGYSKFCRQLLPVTSPATLHALHLNTHALYSIMKFYLKQKMMTMDNTTSIVNVETADANKSAVFQYFIDIAKANDMCQRRHATFDNKLILTSSGTLYLQAIFHKGPSNTPSGSRKHKKLPSNAQPRMAELKLQTQELYRQLRPLKKEVIKDKKRIKQANDDIQTIELSVHQGSTDHRQSSSLPGLRTAVKNRQMVKKELNKLYMKIIHIHNEIDIANKEKSRMFQNLPPSAPSFPSSVTMPMIMNRFYIGVDPGVKTLATSVTMSASQAAGYMMVVCDQGNFKNHILNNSVDLKWLMSVRSHSVQARNLNSKSRTHLYAQQMQWRKKRTNCTVSKVETRLSELTTINDSSILQLHQYGSENRQALIQFYHKSKWAKQQANGSRRFREKAYTTAARVLGSKNGAQVYYGDAGQGHGSRIGGYIRRSTKLLQDSMPLNSNITHTSEYLTSKLCSICHKRVVHPKKGLSGKVNQGTVTCINPVCLGRQTGYASRGRDKNAAINIMVNGIYRSVTGVYHPSFATTSATTVPIPSKSGSSTTVSDILFGPSTSWISKMNDLPSLKGTGDGHSLGM
jgi:hypothetical protein